MNFAETKADFARLEPSVFFDDEQMEMMVYCLLDFVDKEEATLKEVEEFAVSMGDKGKNAYASVIQEQTKVKAYPVESYAEKERIRRASEEVEPSAPYGAR